MAELTGDPLTVGCERPGHAVSGRDVDVAVVAYVVERPAERVSSLPHAAPPLLGCSDDAGSHDVAPGRVEGPEIDRLVNSVAVRVETFLL